MKKLVLTTLILVSAGYAYGQSTVKLSGSVYGGIGYNFGGGGSSYTSAAGPASWMISGREDMGGGNATIFKLESGFNATTGAQSNANALWDKQAYIGIQGAWGTIRAGRLYTPAFSTMALVADSTGTYSVISGANLMETHGVRLNNGIIYNSPGFNPWDYAHNGFAFALAHYFGTDKEKASRNATDGAYLGYGSGPVNIEFAAQRQNTWTSPTSDLNFRSYILGTNYDFKFLKLYVSYSTQTTRNRGMGNVKTKDNSDFLVGIKAPVGPGMLFTSFIYKRDKLNNNAYMLGAVYDYPFSKRTKLTAGIVKIFNRGKGNFYKLNNSYAGSQAGNLRSSAITLGLTHSF